MSPQSIAQNLSVLKQDGLVRAERDPGDGRKTLISASPRASSDSFLVRAIGSLSTPAEQAALDRAIELLEQFAVTRPATAHKNKNPVRENP